MRINLNRKILLLLTLFSLFQACNKEDDKKDDTKKENSFKIQSDKALIDTNKEKTEHKHNDAEELYTCPMHPSVISNKPGSCPICGMTLVKKIKPKNIDSKGNMKEISLSSSQKIMANVKVEKAKYENMIKEIDAVGKVTFDEKKMYRLSSWIAGRINKLYINTTGANISKGEKIFDIYSPEVFSAQQEFLQANESYLKLKDSKFNDISQSAKEILESSKQKLLLMGLTENQVNNLKTSKKTEPNIPIFSSESGTVIKKNVVKGQYVQAGESTFELADLSNLWVEGNINEQDIKDLKVNQDVIITSSSFNDEIIETKIDYIYPMLESDSKSLKIRMNVDNMSKKLKPEMSVKLKIKINLGKKMLLPKTAVIITGKKNIVWVEEKEGIYIPKNIKIGEINGDNYSITSGLKENDNVVVSGGYLLDSESEIKTAGSQHNHDQKPKNQVKSEKDIGMSNMKM